MSRHIESRRAVYSRRRKVGSFGAVETKGKSPVSKSPKAPTEPRAVEKRLSPLQTRVKQYLEAAYLRGQKRKEQSVAVEAPSDLRGKDLLAAFMGTKDFGAFYEIAIKEALRGASWHQDSPRFRGALFQAVVLTHLKRTQLDSSQVLLTGRDVTKFTQMVNRGKPIIEHPYGQQGIDDCYVPDFLVLGLNNNGKVVIDDYGEISLSSDPDKYKPQLTGFLHEKSRLGPLMSKARFRIITPHMDSPLAMQIVPGIEYVDTEPILVTHAAFTHFATEVNRSYRKTPESLTLRQIRREAQVRIGQIRAVGEPQFFRR